MQELVCVECEHIGLPKWVKPGSTSTEVIIWLVLFFPGIIYTLWRIFGKKKVCAQCGNNVLVPMNSNLGMVIAKKKGYDIPDKQPTSMEKFMETKPNASRELVKKVRDLELAKRKNAGKKEKQNSDEW